MKKVVKKYHNHKFCRFINGMLFGIISLGFLTYCTSNVIESNHIELKIIIPFFFAIISMLMGMFTMFRRNRVSEELV